MNIEYLLNKTISEVAVLTQCKSKDLIRLLKKSGIKASTLTKLEEAHLPYLQRDILQKVQKSDNAVSRKLKDAAPIIEYQHLIGKSVSEAAHIQNVTNYFITSKLKLKGHDLSATSILEINHLILLQPHLDFYYEAQKREERKRRAENLTVRKEQKTISPSKKRKKNNKLSNYPSNEASIKIFYTSHPKS